MKKFILKTLVFLTFLVTSTASIAAEQEKEHLLQPGDFLRILIFGIDDLSGEYKLDTGGDITVPLIGEIHASGMSKSDLKNTIAQKLIDGQYYTDPKVTVEIIAMRPFYILGEVKVPGSYEYKPDLDIFKAVAIAGGYTPRAAKNKITIIRKIHGETVKIKATEHTPILPGDSIKVKQRFF